MLHDFAAQNLVITPNNRKRERMNTTPKIDYETSSGCCSDACTGDLFPDMPHVEQNRLTKVAFSVCCLNREESEFRIGRL